MKRTLVWPRLALWTIVGPGIRLATVFGPPDRAPVPNLRAELGQEEPAVPETVTA
jgi:hypothetical protein